jgi:arylsulfatase A-like enzyme
MEMDARSGQVFDFIDKNGLRENTVLIFASDNGPEFRRPWRGTAGPWRGTYHTAMEGALRVPFIVRWPGRVPARVSDEIVHVTDIYTTLARIAGASVPRDRPIDGVDQLDFFFGARQKSNREGFVYYIKQELRAAKWRDWKMHIVWEPEPNIGPKHLETPWVFNLTRDPKEETDVGTEYSWARRPLRVLIENFQASLKQHPPIPPGAPDNYRPG